MRSSAFESVKGSGFRVGFEPVICRKTALQPRSKIEPRLLDVEPRDAQILARVVKHAVQTAAAAAVQGKTHSFASSAFDQTNRRGAVFA